MKKQPSFGRSRDLGIGGGPGKGSASRISDTKAFRENMETIPQVGITGAVRKGARLVKVYR